MMEDEVDYMSDEFITKCLENEADVRPGLLKTKKEQRQHELMKKKNLNLEEKKKEERDSPLEILEEALKQPLDSSNKGFSMLQKMGFRSGGGLGKNQSGIVEPIPISIKNNRQGLGLKKKIKEEKSSGKERKSKINEVDFRAFLSKKNKDREISKDLRKSQKVCRELDQKAKKEKPEELWFWPEDVSDTQMEDELEEVQDEDEPESMSNEEKLDKLVKYLRDVYFYCIWCKVQYEDEKDLGECPGLTRDDH